MTSTKALINMAMLVLIASISFPAYSDTIIGRWCDRTIPNMPKYNRIMTIEISEKGVPVLYSQFNDGSSAKAELTESDGGLYVKIGSKSGDKYRIVESTGNLQLLDNDGFVRTAKRLENSPSKNECQY